MREIRVYKIIKNMMAKARYTYLDSHSLVMPVTIHFKYLSKEF